MDATFTPFHRGGSGPPLVCLHGFADTWRTWELVLPALERDHDVLAPALPGHAGGPPIVGQLTYEVLADAVERAMDEAGFATAHIAGNSLGGFVALQLASRGRAESVVALAPAGGWALGSAHADRIADHFATTLELARAAAPYADQIMAAAEGRRRATQFTAVNYEHIPAELLAHQLCGVAAMSAAEMMIEHRRTEHYSLDAAHITCPVRVVWGTDDGILTWPACAVRYRDEWVPNADWIELEGVGHCPQLDVPLETAQLIVGFTS